MNITDKLDPVAPEERDDAPRRRPRRVRSLYRLGGARWYDFFRALWTRVTSQAAEAALDRLVRTTAGACCRVLDIGCGTGYNLARLRRLGISFGSYLGVDLTDAMLAIARERYADEPRATFTEADLHTLAGTPERFDVILCTWVASHLERPREVFDLAYNLLAPDGYAFFLTFTRPKWYVAWWFTPFARLFQTHYVEQMALYHLPGLKARETWTAGITTLVHLERSKAADQPARGTEQAERGGQRK
jgi:SAM-dependent methyltransferase